MESTQLVFMHTSANGYSPEQCYDTITVGELIEALKQFDENSPIYFCNDNGYSYGSIQSNFLFEGMIGQEED